MQDGEPKLYEVVIVGGGPAGLSAAIYAARKGLETALVTKFIGGQVVWTSRIENYMGFHMVSGDGLIEKFQEQVQEYPIDQLIGKTASKVSAQGRNFAVDVEESETLRSKSVIVTTGKRPKRLGVPNEAKLVGRGVSYCATCDAPFFKGKDVAVIGAGNTAIGSALDLLRIARKVHIITYEITADQILLDRLKGRPNLNILEGYGVTRIEGEDKVSSMTVAKREGGDEKNMALEGIFIEVGWVPNTELVAGLLELNEKAEIIVDCNCETSVPGVFAAGDVTSIPHKQIVVAAGEGAKAALAATDFLKYRKEA